MTGRRRARGTRERTHVARLDGKRGGGTAVAARAYNAAQCVCAATGRAGGGRGGAGRERRRAHGSTPQLAHAPHLLQLLVQRLGRALAPAPELAAALGEALLALSALAQLVAAQRAAAHIGRLLLLALVVAALGVGQAAAVQ